jgi:tetratricopeptide (TPR) repeat protein
MSLVTLLLLKTAIIIDAQTTNSVVPTEILKIAPGETNEKRKAGIAEILAENVEAEDLKSNQTGTPTDISVFDDRIEFRIRNKNKILYYYEFLDQPLSTEQPKIKYYLRVANFKFISRNLAVKNYSGLDLMTSYLNSFQRQLKKTQYDYLLTLFQPVAEKYRALKVKPTISEEQRKYIVQANILNEQKDYQSAIDTYNKAIDIDLTSYPAAYSNMALLSAQIKNYNAAIYYMKKYLLLEPEASDARSAQDKIYEWELMMQK